MLMCSSCPSPSLRCSVIWVRFFQISSSISSPAPAPPASLNLRPRSCPLRESLDGNGSWDAESCCTCDSKTRLSVLAHLAVKTQIRNGSSVWFGLGNLGTTLNEAATVIWDHDLEPFQQGLLLRVFPGLTLFLFVCVSSSSRGNLHSSKLFFSVLVSLPMDFGGSHPASGFCPPSSMDHDKCERDGYEAASTAVQVAELPFGTWIRAASLRPYGQQQRRMSTLQARSPRNSNKRNSNIEDAIFENFEDEFADDDLLEVEEEDELEEQNDDTRKMNRKSSDFSLNAKPYPWKKIQLKQSKQQDGRPFSMGTQRKLSGLASHTSVTLTTGVSPPLKKATTIDGLGLARTATQSRPPQ